MQTKKKDELLNKFKKISQKNNFINDLIRCFIVIISSAIYSLAVIWFLEPAGLVAIGCTALGQVLNRLFLEFNIDISIGVFTFILNLPLCLYGIKYVSPRFIIFTVLSIIVQTIFLLGWVPMIDFGINPDDKLFLAIIAGLFCGIGIGIALRFGTSTGGVDILGQALSLKNGTSVGTISMAINIILAVIAGGIMQGNWSITFYTFIFIIICNIVIDKVHNAYNYLRLDVITKKGDSISKALIAGINRSCTLSDVKGAYTGEMKNELFMVISSYELEKAKRIIYEEDPEAFIMVLPVKRIIGMFFKHTIT